MSCTGRQSVNPNGCCKSGIVRTRCNPNNYWSCPAAGEGEGDVITHVASITLVKVACCVGPCRHDIKWVVRPVTHCLSPCMVSWRSFSGGGLVEEGHKLDYFRVNVIFTSVKMLSGLGPLKQGCLKHHFWSLATTCPNIPAWKFLVILETLITLVQWCLIGVKAKLCRTVALQEQDWTPLF